MLRDELARADGSTHDTPEGLALQLGKCDSFRNTMLDCCRTYLLSELTVTVAPPTVIILFVRRPQIGIS